MGSVLAITSGQWLTFAGVVVGAFATVTAAVITASVVRHQTVPETRPRGSTRSRGAPAERETSFGEVEGFIVRFFLFSLTASLWGAIGQIIGAWLSWTKPMQLAVAITYAAIFISLGGPLLVDIYRRYGIRGQRKRRARS